MTLTDRTLQVIESARRIARGEVVVEFTREDLAIAIVELAGGRPNAIDRRRVDEGDYVRAAGDTECPGVIRSHSSRVVECGRPYREHAVVPGIEWLRRLCDGRFVKL
jgi:hypothetical protein